MAHEAAEIQKQVRVYVAVFAALAALTVVTVAISYLHLSTPAAVGVALVVATVKGALVALYFMHLIHEERAIYWLLGLTAIFFVAVMYLPASWLTNDMRSRALWDQLPQEGHAGAAGGHGGTHATTAEEGRH